MSIQIPRQNTMYEHLHATALRKPNHTALIFYGSRISFAALDRMVDECAAGLLSLGVRRGDRVTFCMPNLPQTVAGVYAVNKIGAICNMLHPLSTPDEVRHGVELVESRVAFCFDVSEKAFSHLPITLIGCKTAAYFERTPMGILRGVLYAQKIRSRYAPAEEINRQLSWEDLLRLGRAHIAENGVPRTVGAKDDTAAIMYTGGTTGSPKGVMLSNDAINALAFQMIPVAGDITDADGMLGVLPVFHGFGFALCMHTAMCVGIRFALIPRFEAKDCCSVILKEKITLIFSVPAFFDRLLKCGGLRGRDISFIRLVGSGGDIVSDDLKRKVDALLAEGGSKTYLISGYGLTECVTACNFTVPPRRDMPTGCVGVPCEGNEMKIVAIDTTEAITEGDGEICVTGPTLMQGYWRDDEETARVLKRHDDGRTWLHTGDIGSIDKEGRLYFKQRFKRVIKVSGYLIYPSQIEEKLRCNSLVEDCCVVGMQTTDGTRVKAFIVPQRPPVNQAEIDRMTSELKSFSSENLNRWSVPAELEFLPELPRTKIGKVDYKALEALMGAP